MTGHDPKFAEPSRMYTKLRIEYTLSACPVTVEYEEVPLEELVHEIMEGKIPDSKTQAAVLRAYLLEKGI